jgi:outer membrane autotransporter protein
MADDLTLQAGLSAYWTRELLDTSYGSKASFRGYSGNTFSVTNRADDRDALALNASVTLASDRNLSLNAHVGAEFFRKRSDSVQGGLSIGWRF